MNELWLVGQYRSGDIAGKVIWDFNGIFSDRDKAIAACRDPNYFIAPVILNEELPHETIIFPRLEWPLR
jgi:hypothetical protein